MSDSKWLWKMEWCRGEGLAPAKEEVWEMAEKAYVEFIQKDIGIKFPQGSLSEDEFKRLYLY